MLKGFWRNVKWMFAIMIAPEYILGKACADLVAAIMARNEMRAFAQEDGVEWGLGHCFFANMGGFVLAARSQSSPLESSSAKDGKDQENHSSLLSPNGVVHDENQITVSVPGPDIEDAVEKIKVLPAQEVEHEGPGFLRREAPTHPRSSGLASPTPSRLAEMWNSENLKYNNPFHLLADDILWLREWGILSKLPDIGSSELHDKSKSDMAIKVIAIFQILWFILHIIVRAIEGIGTSQLEIAVTAFSVCGIITYLLIIQKPKNVQTPIILINYDTEFPIDGLYGLHNRHIQGYLRGLFSPNEDIVNKVEIMGAPIPNDALKSFQLPIRVLHFGVAIGGVIFGSIHIAAWDFDFPTTADRDIWRAASIESTVLMPVMYSALFYNEFVARFKSRLFLKS
jgi:hypothetical protein